MSGENGHTTPPAESAAPVVETKEDVTKNPSVDAQKEASAAETKAAAESEAEPAPAAAEHTEDSSKSTEGNMNRTNCVPTCALTDNSLY